MAVLVRGDAFDKLFIFEQDAGLVVAGIAGAKLPVEDGLLVEGFSSRLAVIVGTVAGLYE